MAPTADDAGWQGSVSYFEVRFRPHPAVVVLLLVAVCAGVVAGLAYFRARRTATVQGLASFLPDGDGAVLALDLAALRQVGLMDALSGSSVAQEPEYVAFVRDTGFNYASDLDYALVWFGKDSVGMLLRGRFQWQKLRDYTSKQGGVCQNSFCRLGGSTPQRKISFFPLGQSVMALAVSQDEWAATSLNSPKPSRKAMPIPADRPVWLSLPPSVLHNSDSLPSGTRLFAKAVEGAERVVLTLQSSGAGTAVELDVTCRSVQDAETLVFQLQGVTDLLKKLIASEHQTPNEGDLSGVLASGVFNRVDTRVLGRWPVRRQFLNDILGTSK